MAIQTDYKTHADPSPTRFLHLKIDVQRLEKDKVRDLRMRLESLAADIHKDTAPGICKVQAT